MIIGNQNGNGILASDARQVYDGLLAFLIPWSQWLFTSQHRSTS